MTEYICHTIYNETKSQNESQRSQRNSQKSIVDAATAEEKNPAAVAIGKLGGLKGGRARVNGMTPEQRKESARKAAQARWSKKT